VLFQRASPATLVCSPEPPGESGDFGPLSQQSVQVLKSNIDIVFYILTRIRPNIDVDFQSICCKKYSRPNFDQKTSIFNEHAGENISDQISTSKLGRNWVNRPKFDIEFRLKSGPFSRPSRFLVKMSANRHRNLVDLVYREVWHWTLFQGTRWNARFRNLR